MAKGERRCEVSQQVQTFVYGGAQVAFDISGEGNVMVNATEMAKIFGKRIDHFLKSDHATEFMKLLEFPPNGVNSAPLSKDEIILTKGQSGTWMHRILALKFAAWLNPAFELWVYKTIDDLLFGRFRKMEASLKESAERRVRMQDLRKTLQESDAYIELEQLELQEKRASIQRSRENRFQLELFMTEGASG